jgi:hypothetical protein
MHTEYAQLSASQRVGDSSYLTNGKWEWEIQLHEILSQRGGV